MGTPSPLTPYQIATVCHEANRGYQSALGEDVSLPWEECGNDMRQSIVHGVNVAQEGNGPEEMHRQWAMVREAQGWVFGAVKDTEAKTHPNLIPYDKLPESQKLKDRLFLAVVAALSLANESTNEEG